MYATVDYSNHDILVIIKVIKEIYCKSAFSVNIDVLILSSTVGKAVKSKKQLI